MARDVRLGKTLAKKKDSTTVPGLKFFPSPQRGRAWVGVQAGGGGKPQKEETMIRDENIAVVESYIYGLGKGDFSEVPFAADVSYESPLTARKTGQEAIDFLSALFPIMRGADIKQHIVEGEYVATLFYLRTPNGVTAVFDKFRVVDGTLKEINPYYDPTVLKEAVQQLR